MATASIETPTPAPPPTTTLLLRMSKEEASMLKSLLLASVLWSRSVGSVPWTLADADLTRTDGEFGNKMRDIFYALHEAGVEEDTAWRPSRKSHLENTVSRIWEKRS